MLLGRLADDCEFVGFFTGEFVLNYYERFLVLSDFFGAYGYKYLDYTTGCIFYSAFGLYLSSFFFYSANY